MQFSKNTLKKRAILFNKEGIAFKLNLSIRYFKLITLIFPSFFHITLVAKNYYCDHACTLMKYYCMKSFVYLKVTNPKDPKN